MKCEQVQEGLTAYLLDDLDAELRSDIQAHLLECNGCRAAAQEIEPTLELLRDALAATAAAPGRLSAGARHKVMRSRKRKASKLVWLWQSHPVLVQAAAVLVVGFIIVGILLPSLSRSRSIIGYMSSEVSDDSGPASVEVEQADLFAAAPKQAPPDMDVAPENSRLSLQGTKFRSVSGGADESLTAGDRVRSSATAAPAAPSEPMDRSDRFRGLSEDETGGKGRAFKPNAAGALSVNGRVAGVLNRANKDLSHRLDSVEGAVYFFDDALGRDAESAANAPASAPQPLLEEAVRSEAKAGKYAPQLGEISGETRSADTYSGKQYEVQAGSAITAPSVAEPVQPAQQMELGRRYATSKESPQAQAPAVKTPERGKRVRTVVPETRFKAFESAAMLAETAAFGLHGAVAEAPDGQVAGPAGEEAGLGVARIATLRDSDNRGMGWSGDQLRSSLEGEKEQTIALAHADADGLDARKKSAPTSGGKGANVAAASEFARTVELNVKSGKEEDANGGWQREYAKATRGSVVGGRIAANEDFHAMGGGGGMLDEGKGDITGTQPPAVTLTPAKPSDRAILQNELDKIVIPEVDFQNAKLEDVVAFLNEAQVEFDGTGSEKTGQIKLGEGFGGGGVDVPAADRFAAVGRGEARSDTAGITFKAKNISVGEALRIVSAVANTKVVAREKGRGLELRPLSAPQGELAVRAYDVDTDLGKALKEAGAEPTDAEAVKTVLADLGVAWPDGSTVSYALDEKKLVVGNTVNNLQTMEGVLDDMRVEAQKKEEEASTRFQAVGVNPFVGVERQPFSTFAIDVDTAAYTLARNYMMRGRLPPAEAVRTEEFVNFFDYDYRPPQGDTFGVYAELAPSRFGRGMSLLKIGVKGRRLGREEQRQAVLTFLVDSSGSMGKPDRIGLVKQSLRLLVEQLGPEDLVAIVQYGSEARLLLEHTPAARKAEIIAAIDGMQCGGSTNLEKGMKRAYGVAAQGFVGGGENRVLVLSDGVANLGTGSAADILKDVARFRRQGITCSVFGFGMGTYDDVMLETLANKGDGTYTFIDSEDEARRIFVDDLSATLNTIATDVKIQVEFMPDQVKMYRQLGYENRQLRKEDFRNDSIDAGEVGSGQAVTALYEMELQPPRRIQKGAQRRAREEKVAIVRVRYRRVDSGQVEEIEHAVMRQDLLQDFDKAPVRFRLAAAVAEFAEILRGSPFAAGSEFEAVAQVLRPVALDLTLDERVQELLRMVQSATGMGRGE